MGSVGARREDRRCLALHQQMPLGEPKLNALLIEIIRLWIEAGAPEIGWVPGTDQ